MKKQNRITRIDILKERHQILDDEADALSCQHYLSEAEKTKLKRLKVLRLRIKDLILELENEVE